MVKISKVQSFDFYRYLLFFIVATLVSVFVSYSIAQFGANVGLLAIFFPISIILFVIIVKSKTTGYIIVFLLSAFYPAIDRLSNGLIPQAIVELMMVLVLAAVIINDIYHWEKLKEEWNIFKNPIFYMFIVWVIYSHLQIANPGNVGIKGWLEEMRYLWYNILGYIIGMRVFKDFKNIKIFIKVLIFTGFLFGLNAIRQKYIGLLPYEMEWLYADVGRSNLYVIWGQIRVWSFFNGPTNLGLFMTLCTLISLVLILAPIKLGTKFFLGFAVLIMQLANVASGTRTAIIMMVIGVMFFGFLTITNKNTLIFGAFISVLFLGIYFGPFYNPQINRIRSAFENTNDPSMNIREVNKHRIQPYIYRHPFGGGFKTAGQTGLKFSPGHPLAGFPPDSGYLLVALEAGWIGLILICSLYCTALALGIKYYFEVKDPLIKSILLAFIIGFMALSVSGLTQFSMILKPLDFYVFAFYTIILRIKQIDDAKANQENELSV